ncbi:unnamed protein product [Ilex paraguariensis]|uniref:Uncharacterized protein n=1 Tax=Ilex paraguariensis TaxID=185542 RepID=A0ABC8SLX3_9AQUA
MMSKGEAKATFLRHEGFLGALGAFLSYKGHGLDGLMTHQQVDSLPKSVCWNGDELRSSVFGNLNENGSIECSVQLSN